MKYFIYLIRKESKNVESLVFMGKTTVLREALLTVKSDYSQKKKTPLSKEEVKKVITFFEENSFESEAKNSEALILIGICKNFLEKDPNSSLLFDDELG